MTTRLFRRGPARSYLLVPMMPTPNGSLHLGHVSGPYLKVDVLARALRQAGHEVALISTTDVSDTHMLQAAVKYGTTPEEAAARFHGEITRDFEYMDIRFDAFINPLSGPWAARFRAVHAAVADALLDNGGAQCVKERFLFDTRAGEPLLGCRLSGKCPQCGTSTVGFVCESCGLQVTTEMLGAPGGEAAGRSLEWREGDTLALRLRAKEALQERISGTRLPAEFKAAMSRYLEDEANLVRLTVLEEYGVGPYRREGREFLLYNTYFGHAVFCGQVYAELFGKARNAFALDSDVITATSVGLDNATDLSANMAFAAAHGGYRDFDHHLGNFFLTLQGLKFSTSLRHAIFVADLIGSPAVSVDATRLFLASISPEQGVRDFQVGEFLAFHNDWFAGGLGEALQRAGRVVGAGPVAGASEGFVRELEEAVARRDQALSLDAFSVQGAAEVVRGWASAPRLADATGAYWWLKGLAYLAAPLMPAACAQVWRALGHTGEPTADALFSVPAHASLAELLPRLMPISRADIRWSPAAPVAA